MQVDVRFFAASRELVGLERRIEVLPEGATLQTLQDRLYEAYPALPSLRVRFAVNLTYASGPVALHDGDVVACIPPVGGG